MQKCAAEMRISPTNTTNPDDLFRTFQKTSKFLKALITICVSIYLFSFYIKNKHIFIIFCEDEDLKMIAIALIKSTEAWI